MARDDSPPFESVSLRDYFERVFTEHEHMHEQLAEGITVARNAQDKRLDAMNEFRAALTDQANQMVSREVFDSAIREREARINALADRVVALEKTQVTDDALANIRTDQDRQRMTVRLAVAGVILGVFANFLINLIQGSPK